MHACTHSSGRVVFHAWNTLFRTIANVLAKPSRAILAIMVARSVLGVVAMLACSPIAIADPAPPWAVGVTEAQKVSAKALLDEGNDLFLAGRYADALERFRRSLAVWQHPATRFNIARSLIALDRLAEAADELELALAYGAAPLQHNHEPALAYQKLLAKQVGTLVVDCTDPGIVL